MPRIHIKINRCVQNSQEYGSDDEHMICVVYFHLFRDGKERGPYRAELKQPVGDRYTPDNLEVRIPKGQGYKGPFSHEKFSRGVREYYSQLVNKQGAMISLGNSTNTTMRNNTFEIPFKFSFEADEKTASW